MIKVHKVNRVKVKPIHLPQIEKKNIKGKDLFDELYFNVFICSRKKSGKTQLIWNILNKCTNKLSKVIIFCPTIHKDNTYQEIIKKLQDRGINVVTFTSFIEDGVDQLKEMINFFQTDQKEEDEEGQKVRYVKFDDEEEEDEKKYKPKKLAPEYVIVMDDMASELKNKNVANLLKTHRHYHSSCIVSSQYPNDCTPESIKQFDYLILFKNHSTNKLEEIHQRIDTSLPFEEFEKLYEFATKKPFSFLKIDTRNDTFYENFDKRLEISGK